MTGMKEGAGEDPFAEDPDPTTLETNDDSSANDADATPATESPDTDSGGSPDRRAIQIPYKFRRDGVQDGRDRVPLFLKPETKRDERDALRDLEERFDDDVSLTDLREALVMVGLQNLDDVEEQLEAWGYGITFDT